MSHKDREAEKVLRGKFLIGAENFWGSLDNFIFFGVRSNGTALLWAVFFFFLFGKMKMSTTGYLCSKRRGTRRVFSFITFRRAKVAERLAESVAVLPE